MARYLLALLLPAVALFSALRLAIDRPAHAATAPVSARIQPDQRPLGIQPTVTPAPTPPASPLPSGTPTAAPLPSPTAALSPTPVSTPAHGSGYWHTSHTAILNAHNHRVRIAGVTWYGMETTYWVPAGLDYQPYQRILSEVKHLGYNTVRLPFSNELVETNPLVSEHVDANPDLRGLHALDVLDRLVTYAGQIGLKIILDDHISLAESPKTVNNLDEPLWYTAQYPEASWIADWQTLARRYRGNSTVIGFDLRNEPHTAGPGPWSLKTYLFQGATWGPYAGVDNTATDWRLAAERAGNAVLAIEPHLLIFVEGVQLYPDPSQPHGVATGWWGWNFSMVKRYPVVLKVAHRLVYSPHDYGPNKSRMAWFAHNSYATQLAVWRSKWAYILDNPEAPYAAPILLGEFGTCTNQPTCVDEVREGNQAQWLHMLLRFMKEHPNVGWDFYALNGTNANDHAANNGLLSPTWDAVANAALQRDLAGIQH